MRVDELEAALRDAAAGQPAVSRTAYRDVVRRGQRTRRRNRALAGAALVAVIGVVGFSVADLTRSSHPTRVLTKPGPSVGVTVPTPPPSVLPAPQHAGAPVGFGAASATFVSTPDGWALGTAPCHASPPCTVVVRTKDGGRSWSMLPAPPFVLGVTPGGGVSKIRFADQRNGWAFGDQLWSTHDGGLHWSRVSLPGVGADASVRSLEGSVGLVHAAVLDQAGPIKIETSLVDVDTFQPSPTSVEFGAGPVPEPQIVLKGDAGWLIENDRTVVGGARLQHGIWVPWQPPCGSVGGPATLAASSPTEVVAVCAEGIWNGTPRATWAYVSHDAGVTFAQTRTPDPADFSAVANPATGTIFLGTLPGTAPPELVVSRDVGSRWSTAYRSMAPQAAAGTWTDLGFTSSSQGMAILTVPGEGGIMLMTFDGGKSWKPVSFGPGSESGPCRFQTSISGSGSLTVCPGWGPVGTPVTVDGTGCGPQGPAETTVRFDGNPSTGSANQTEGADQLPPVPTDAHGRFQASYVIPAAFAPGSLQGKGTGGPVRPGLYQFHVPPGDCFFDFMVTPS